MLKQIVILAVIAIGIQQSAFAQTQVSTTIKEVTVFRQMALVSRSGKATIPAGRGTLVLSGLSPEVDQSSVRLSATGDFTILTVNPRSNFLAANPETPEMRTLKKEQEQLSDAIARADISLNVLAEEEGIILANKAIGGSNTGVSVAELQKMAEYANTRLTELRLARHQLNSEQKTRRERLQQLNQQMQEINKGQQRNVTEVVVQYQSEAPVQAEFQLDYLVQGAYWNPTYDLRVADLSKPVTLAYGALVTQSTGEDWTDVKLVLSTGNPREQQNAPVVKTWWLSPISPLAYGDYPRAKMEELAVQSNMAVRSDAAAPQAQFAGAEVGINLTKTEFSIRLPQDIPSNGQEYRVLVDDYELPANYQYYAAPCYDNYAYLTARVTDWQKYNLLSGPVNLFFDGSFVGSSHLQPQIAGDTLAFSLGRDKGIVIERKREENYRSRRLLGSKVEQRMGWTINVQKNRRNDIAIVIEDQIPVSTTDQIEVELEQAKGADYNPATGILRWELPMKMGEKRELNFRYIVKHPKDMQLNLQ